MNVRKQHPGTRKVDMCIDKKKSLVNEMQSIKHIQYKKYREKKTDDDAKKLSEKDFLFTWCFSVTFSVQFETFAPTAL